MPVNVPVYTTPFTSVHASDNRIYIKLNYITCVTFAVTDLPVESVNVTVDVWPLVVTMPSDVDVDDTTARAPNTEREIGRAHV